MHTLYLKLEEEFFDDEKGIEGDVLPLMKPFNNLKKVHIDKCLIS